MNPADEGWNAELVSLFDRSLKRYRADHVAAMALVGTEDADFLRGSGLTPFQLFDFVEDFAAYGEPLPETFFALARIRREYFLGTLGGRWPASVVPESALPLRSDELEGIPWLPRIAAKARCFLEGTLCPEVMLGCGGDRAFVQRHGLRLEDFLCAVRDGCDLAAFVRAGAPRA